MAKSWAKKFYHSIGWEKVRKLCLIRDHYLCQECGEAAYIVHHIIELNPENIKDPNITLNLDNLKCVCKACHDEIHSVCQSKSTIDNIKFDENGDIIEIRKPENLRKE
jgi:5-methylcytosine-specific restriction endonuclease McrA